MPPTPGSARIANDDLVLDVRSDFDPERLRLDAYEAFLDALCGTREFQKEAIRAACRFLAGGTYETTRDLAAENFAAKPVMADHYGSLSALVGSLPLRDRLACDIDLATGTGKSWVMYGITQILLCEGVVDRVLVLCPSLTIESALRAKFRGFVQDTNLKSLLPLWGAIPNPEVVDANVTASPGDICIENIDATYRHVRSSVRDSFAGKGGSTLVLNDECHHVYSPPGGTSSEARAIKKWKEFLEDPEFSFHRIVGLSGTPYIKDTYLPSVIYRYSLRQAMEDGRVKEVRYVARDDSTSEDERFQKYLQAHRDNQRRYPGLKPITILVTGKIDTCEVLADNLVAFLSRELKITPDEAARQVLVVTSAARHKANVAQLPHVDDAQHPAEWVVSVSMLTEGWDVQNVFQVVPHEKRAFNSKLLIAQVLGRGLRVPLGTSRPKLAVFNHASWSGEIAGLVAEVLEIDRRLHSHPVTVAPRDAFHFDLHHLTYTTRSIEQDLPLKDQSGQVQLFKRGYISFESQPEELTRQTVFADALRPHEESIQSTQVHFDAYTIQEVVQKLRNRLRSVDLEGETNYLAEYPEDRLREVIQASLDRIHETRDLVSERNLQNALRALGNTQRRMARTVRVELDPDQLYALSTRDMRSRSVAMASFRRDATVFYDSESTNLSDDVDVRALSELADDDSTFPRNASHLVANSFRFKSPTNVVLTSHSPERSFVRRLFEPGVADHLAAWVKSPDTGFYEIAYSWRKGDHTKVGKFNPDFFLRLVDGSSVLAVELKDDQDASDENRAKLKAASGHFDRINSSRGEVVYSVLFLSPTSYDGFFQALRQGEAASYVSALQAALQL